ncbi:hypothetical protein E2320_009720 [Naja naja]|nr:hypothetical protein E2320_009720 [Naja naja]
MTITSGNNPPPRTLKCLPWNIEGWERRCGTTEFTNYIQSFDVVLLQETWACNKISFTGFTVTSLATTKQTMTGRPKGSLACLVSTSLKVETVELPPCGSLAMVLLIKGGHSKLLVFNVYLPPTVRQAGTKAQWGMLENYITCMETKFPKDNNKIIFNGSTLGHLAGEFTFSSSHGSSVIDFVLVSQLLRKAVHAFYVNCLTERDHYPLVTIIGLSSNIHLPRGPQILDPYVASYTRKIKWSSNTERKFHSFLSSPECLSLYNQALTSSSPETILAFESLINSVQRELGADRRPSGPYHSRSNPWFDKECLMLRNQINRVYLLYHNRGDKCPPEDYYRLKQEYKGLIAKKKRAKERENSFPGHQELPLCCISNRDWENHFLSIFQITSLTELGPQLPPAIPDWQPSAFDSIPRGLLWSKLLKSSIDRHLLFLIRSLYNQTSSQVRCGLQGELSNPIPIKSGVRQGCVLAPLLFNLFLSDLASYIGHTESHAPKMSTTKIPLLLYADNAVLFSLSRPGLKRLLSAFGSYCAENHLSINYDKSKVLVFSRARKLYN